MFVVFYGSWNRAPMEPGGHQVTVVPQQRVEFTGHWETFAERFAGRRRLMRSQRATHRPSGTAQGPGGSTYVTDDTGARFLFLG